MPPSNLLNGRSMAMKKSKMLPNSLSVPLFVVEILYVYAD